MPWKVGKDALFSRYYVLRLKQPIGGNFEAVAICYGTNWRDCVKAVANYFWSEVVSDVVDYVAKEELIWVILVAISFLIFLYIKYRKTTYSKNIVLDNQILSDMIHTLQDLELKVNVLTYKMQYGTLPLPHEIDNLSSKKLKKIRMTLSSPCDRKTWIKHMLQSEDTRCLAKRIKETTFCDEQTSIKTEEVTKKKKSRENKDVGGYFPSNNVNVPIDVNDTGAFSTHPILPTTRATRNVQSSRQMLHQVKRKLHSLHNILRLYQHVNSPQSSEKLDSIDQVDEIDAFTFIEPEIKYKSKSVAEIRNVSSEVSLKEETRFSKMTNNYWECCELDRLRTSSSSSSIGYSSNASTKTLQRSVSIFEDDLPALTAVRTDRRHSSGAIMQEKEDKRSSGSGTLACARNISNWSKIKQRSNDSSSFIPFAVDKGAKSTTKRQKSNARSNARVNEKSETKKRVCYMLSGESFGDKSARTKTEASSSTEGYDDIARLIMVDGFDKGVLSSRSGDSNQVSSSGDKEERSTALLLREALRFKRALLTQIRSRSVENRRFAAEASSLKRNKRSTTIRIEHPQPIATSVENRNRIPETSSEYFSITDMAIRHDNGCNTTDEGNVSPSLKPPQIGGLYDVNVITIGIPMIDANDLDDDMDDERETPIAAQIAAGAVAIAGVSSDTRNNRVESRENSPRRETNVDDTTDDLAKGAQAGQSAPKLQDLILTHVNNIRDYVAKFLQGQNKTISTARRALRYRVGEEEKSIVLHRPSNEVSRATLRDSQLSAVFNPAACCSPMNNSPSLLSTNTRYDEHLSLVPSHEDDTFESCTDVRPKGDAPRAFTIPAESTFNEKDGTRWLETAKAERRKETNLFSLPVIARYRGESDLSNSTRDIQYVTSKRNKDKRQIMAGINMGQRYAQIDNKSEDIAKGSNLISRDSWYVFDTNLVTSCKSMSRQPVKYYYSSSEERADVLTFFDKSQKRELLERKSVTLLNPAASSLRRFLLLGVKRPMPDVSRFLNDSNQNNAISANINHPQFKANSDTSLITVRSKDLNFSLKKSYSFSVRTDYLTEHIRKPLRQSYTKLHNSIIKRIENKSQPVTRSTSVIHTSPRGDTFAKSLIPMSENHLEASARRMKRQTHSPTHANPTSILWGDKLCNTKDDTKRYLFCAENTVVNSLTESNADEDNSVKQSQKYLTNTDASSKKTLEILLNEQSAQFRRTEHKTCDSSRSDTRTMKHVESVAPEGVIVISIIENNSLQKRNLVYKNGLWSEESLEEKGATAKPSIADTCTSISDLH